MSDAWHHISPTSQTEFHARASPSSSPSSSRHRDRGLGLSLDAVRSPLPAPGGHEELEPRETGADLAAADLPSGYSLQGLHRALPARAPGLRLASRPSRAARGRRRGRGRRRPGAADCACRAGCCAAGMSPRADRPAAARLESCGRLQWRAPGRRSSSGPRSERSGTPARGDTRGPLRTPRGARPRCAPASAACPSCSSDRVRFGIRLIGGVADQQRGGIRNASLPPKSACSRDRSDRAGAATSGAGRPRPGRDRSTVP